MKKPTEEQLRAAWDRYYADHPAMLAAVENTVHGTPEHLEALRVYWDFMTNLLVLRRSQGGLPIGAACFSPDRETVRRLLSQPETGNVVAFPGPDTPRAPDGWRKAVKSAPGYEARRYVPKDK